MNVSSAKFTESGTIDAVIDNQRTFVPDDMENGHRVMIAEWQAKGNVIEPYVDPEPTPEELRALMPPLSRRQFWLGAHSLGIAKADVMAYAANDPALLIEVEESTEFQRTYGAVTLLSPFLGITDEQLDDVWMWFAAA